MTNKDVAVATVEAFKAALRPSDFVAAGVTFVSIVLTPIFEPMALLAIASTAYLVARVVNISREADRQYQEEEEDEAG